MVAADESVSTTTLPHTTRHSATPTLTHTTSPATTTLSPAQTVPPTKPIAEEYADVDVEGMPLFGDLLSLILSEHRQKIWETCHHGWLGRHMGSLG